MKTGILVGYSSGTTKKGVAFNSLYFLVPSKYQNHTGYVFLAKTDSNGRTTGVFVESDKCPKLEINHEYKLLYGEDGLEEIVY